MATYKVLQDIEADDKLIGPLSLKQAIFAALTGMLLYLSFVAVVNGLPLLLIVLLPPAVFFAALAIPWSREQPTEVWLLARLRFYFKPKRRLWNSSGIEQLVTVTAPKHADKIFTDNLSQTEVKSRLRALADTIDSRGWAVKNVNVNLSAQAAATGVDSDSDRLIGSSSLPHDIMAVDINAADDIMDEHNNPVAHNLEAMIQASARNHKKQVINTMDKARSGNDESNRPNWFMNAPQTGQQTQPGGAAPPAAAKATPEEAAFIKSHVGQDNGQSNMHKLEPLERQTHTSHKTRGDNQEKTSRKEPDAPMPRRADPAIMMLADRDDLTIDTLGREARRAKGTDSSNGEVVVPLR